jgi:tartrate dehydratase beta subunit/fumarate hydratase class I family protein
MSKEIVIPVEDPRVILDLRAGEEVFLNGQMYTARDAARPAGWTRTRPC